MEEPDEINENTAINVQPLPSQDRWKATTAAIFRKYLKEFKDLSYLVENLGDALGYLTNIIQSLRKRQQEVFKFSNEKWKKEMHLQRKLEVNKLPDVEIKIITKNGILTDLTIGKKKFTPNTVFKLPYLDKN